MIKKHRKGQSTLEYVLLVTAVIIVLIALLVGPTSPFRNAYNASLQGSLDRMGNVSNVLFTP